MNHDDLSYARCAETRAGRVMIRGIENLSGRKRLIRNIVGYQNEMTEARSFWDVLWDRFDLRLDVRGAGLEAIPRDGPCIVVANHPFGIVDGLAFGMILQRVRPGFRFLANEWLVNAPEIAENILPIDRSPTRAAMETNIRTRRQAISALKGGGCVGVFPAGAIAYARRGVRQAMDESWKTFTATMIWMSGARVVPMYIDGQNSRLYQLAAQLSKTLSTALLMNEFDNRIGGDVRVAFGEPVEPAAFASYRRRPEALMEALRTRTYALKDAPPARATS